MKLFPSLLLPLVLLTSVGCRHLPSRTGSDVRVMTADIGALPAKNPNDIAIAPVSDLRGTGTVPDLPLREAFAGALVKRRYSPLALDLIDSQAIDAAYRPGDLREDAVLEILVHNWDEHLWATRAALICDVEVRLIDPANESLPLWNGRLAKRFDFASERARQVSDQELFGRACDDLAGELLSKLPARETVPGR